MKNLFLVKVLSVVIYTIEIVRAKRSEIGIGESSMHLLRLMITPNPEQKNLPITSRRVLEIRAKLSELFMVTLSGTFV